MIPGRVRRRVSAAGAAGRGRGGAGLAESISQALLRPASGPGSGRRPARVAAAANLPVTVTVKFELAAHRDGRRVRLGVSRNPPAGRALAKLVPGR